MTKCKKCGAEYNDRFDRYIIEYGDGDGIGFAEEPAKYCADCQRQFDIDFLKAIKS